MNPTAHTSRTRTSRRIALALGAVAALATVGQAAAIPAGGGIGDPQLPPVLNPPPNAVLDVSANPVVLDPIVVLPNLPVAQLAGLGEMVTFDASRSTDIGGAEPGIIKYQWDLDGDGTYERTTQEDSVTRRYSEPGAFTAKLRVTDTGGKTDTASVQMRIHKAPVAKVTTSKTVALVGEGVTFDSAASSDDNGITARVWDLDDNGTFERTDSQVTTSFGTVGPHKVTLRVTDLFGASRSSTATVRVHRAPTAVLAATPASPIVNQQVTLSGAGSTDDGTIAKYQFDLNGDGTFETDTAAVPTTTTTFTTPGPKTVGMKVTDADGVADQTTLTIQVGTPPTGGATGGQGGQGGQTANDTLASKLRPASARMRARSGKVSFRVACPASEQACTVSATALGIAKPLRGKRLGTVRATVAGGTSKVMTMRLSPTAKGTLRRRAIGARMVLTSVDAAGNSARTTTAVTIRR